MISFLTLIRLLFYTQIQGLLYNVYTKPMYYGNIDTLAALDESNMKISVESHALRNLFGGNQAESKTLQSLNEKFQFAHVGALKKAAYYQDICSVERFSDILIIIQVMCI